MLLVAATAVAASSMLSPHAPAAAAPPVVHAVPVAQAPPLAQPAEALAPAQRLAPIAPSAPVEPVAPAPVAPANFPMAPVPRCDILSNFGDGRSGGRAHEGIDILATKGQEVFAMVDGTLTLQVVAGSNQSGASLSGNLWQLTAATGGTYYIYAHLSAFADGLSKGSKVTKGQLIGYVGDTGNPGAGNYHLHFEIHPGGGAAVDPLTLLRPVPVECKVY